jgi:ribosomal protein L21
MGKRNKRARTLINKMNILNQIPDAETAKKYGIEEQVNARIRVEEENSLRIQKLKEAQEAEAKAAKLKAEAEAAELRAKEEAKKEAELKAKKEAELKAKKVTPVKKAPRRRAPKKSTKKS